MTTITLSTDNLRSLKAVQIAATAGQWLNCTERATGRKFTGVPSQCKPGLVYLTTPTSCTCRDSVYRPNLVCKHQLALRLQHILSIVVS